MNKIKIAVAIGHTLSGADFGAKGYLTESICTREIGEKVKVYLEEKGYEVVFCRIDSANSLLPLFFSLIIKFSFFRSSITLNGLLESL